MNPEIENVTEIETEIETVSETTVVQTETENTQPEPKMLEGVVHECAKLNVRKEPSTSAPVVCTILKGTEVAIFEEESTDEFYKICTASGIEGYCMKQFIKI